MFQLSGSELQLKQTSFTHPSVCMAFPGMSDPTYSAQSNITNNSYRGSAAWWQQLSAVSICSILYLFPSHPLNHRNCCLKWLLNGQCTAKVQNIKQRYPLKRFQWNITSWFVGLAVCLPVFQFSALLQCTSNCCYAAPGYYYYYYYRSVIVGWRPPPSFWPKFAFSVTHSSPFARPETVNNGHPSFLCSIIRIRPESHVTPSHTLCSCTMYFRRFSHFHLFKFVKEKRHRISSHSQPCVLHGVSAWKECSACTLLPSSVPRR